MKLIPNNYNLKSIIRHEGQTLDSGHYKSYLFTNNKWTEYDDFSVSDNVATPMDGFMIFYEKSESSSINVHNLEDNEDPVSNASKSRNLKRKSTEEAHNGCKKKRNNAIESNTSM